MRLARTAAIVSIALKLAVGSVASSAQTIDLRERPEESVELPVRRRTEIRPGGDNRPWPPPERVYELPLSVAIVDVTPLEGGLDWDIGLEIINSGREAFQMPVSVDADRASMLPGNIGRRQMSFAIEATTPGEAVISLSAGHTEGSVSAASSLLQLLPGESVQVRIRVLGAWRMSTWIEQGATQATLRARLNEDTWSDGGLFVERYLFPPLYSDNAVVVSLRPE